MDKFKIVERPKSASVRGAVARALRDTLKSGKAVELPASWQPGSYASLMASQGLRLRTHRKNGHIYVWVEKRDELV